MNNKNTVINFSGAEDRGPALLVPGQIIYSTKAFLFQLLNEIQYFILIIVFILL